MLNKEAKITTSFRINPILMDKFTKLTYHNHGFGGTSKILEYLIQQYVNKFDDSIELNNPIRTTPSLMADMTNEIIPFLKSLDLQINSAPENKKGMLDGPLEFVLNNCRNATIYARALRVRRVMGTTSFETQKQTNMTFEEAYKMIKTENMEEHMNRRLYEIHFDALRQVKESGK